MNEDEVIDANAIGDRTLLDQLLADSRLYHQSADYKSLLDFCVQMRRFSPFNAMLLHVQKPGLTFAAYSTEWRALNRAVKPDARPLLILVPFGPVAFVWDVQDTHGEPLPDHLLAFPTRGDICADDLAYAGEALWREDIRVEYFDAGDGKAGNVSRAEYGYRIGLNQNHSPPVQFATLAHELGHLYLGHIGQDPDLKIRARPPMNHAQRELEAESVSYLVCKRLGVETSSSKYLAEFVDDYEEVGSIDTYQVMRAAHQVQQLIEPKRLRPESLPKSEDPAMRALRAIFGQVC